MNIERAIIRTNIVCLGLTLIPIGLGFASCIVFGQWRLLSDPDLIRGVLFIITSDIAIIASEIIIYFGYKTLSKKVNLRLSVTLIIILFATSSTAGFLLDFFIFYVGSGGIDSPFWQSYNFTISIPVYLLLLIIVILLLRIKNRIIIIFLSLVISVSLMILTVSFYAIKLGDSLTYIYGMMSVMGFIPSVIVGLTYGSIISDRLDTIQPTS